MIVIVGLVVLLAAVIVGFTGVLTNSGPDHSLPDHFNALGYHVTGSTGTLFLFGMMVGAIAMLGLSVLLAGTRHTAARGRDARHKLERSRRETAFLNQERDQRLAHDQDDAEADTTGPIVTRRRPTLFGRRPAGRHQGSATEVDASGRTSTVATVAQSRATDNDRQGVRNEDR
jgi:hypothetical protein